MSDKRHGQVPAANVQCYFTCCSPVVLQPLSVESFQRRSFALEAKDTWQHGSIERD